MKMLVNINHSCDLLPHFVRHYREIGITKFLIGVPKMSRLRPMIENVMDEAKVDHLVETIETEPNSALQGRRDCYDQDIRRKKHIESGWYCIADLDEFVVFGSKNVPIESVITLAEAGGFNVIAGGMFDRFTPDGTLPEKFDENIWRQFPVCVEATKHMVIGNASKMVAARWDVEIGPGHHVYETPEKKHWWIAQVHHFKWGANLAAVQKLRIEDYRDKGLVYRESVNVLKHLADNGGQINVEELVRQDMAHRLRLSREIVELRKLRAM